MITVTDQNIETIYSDEYNFYLKALCRLASGYVSRIRVQFAEKAYEMYQNETVRRIVNAYGDEIEKLDESRIRDFTYTSHYGATTEDSLNDSCLNKAMAYGDTIKMLFDIA